MKVFIGYDAREPEAYRVASWSLKRRASIPVTVTALDINRLESSGLLRRPTDRRGRRYDIPSNANASTDFAISRFLTPILAQEGWALFMDCDMVVLEDIAEILKDVRDQPGRAMYCVMHNQKAGLDTKMDGQLQLHYARKNWSSVMLFDCSHPANRRLSLLDVQERKGLDLHTFYWLADSEIGALHPSWNWLVGVQDKPEKPRIAHFTLGGPFLPDWHGGPDDDIWLKEANHEA